MPKSDSHSLLRGKPLSNGIDAPESRTNCSKYELGAHLSAQYTRREKYELLTQITSPMTLGKMTDEIRPTAEISSPSPMQTG